MVPHAAAIDVQLVVVALACAAMVVPAGALFVVTVVCMNTVAHMTSAVLIEAFSHTLAFLWHGECLDHGVHKLIAANC